MDETSPKDPKNSQIIDISMKTVLKIMVVLLALYFLYAIRSVVGVLFVSFVLAAAIDPWIDTLSKRKIPRSVSVIAIYLIALGVFSLVIILLVPPISQQIGEIAHNFPKYYDQVISAFTTLKSASEQYGIFDSTQSGLQSLGSNLNKITGSVFTTLTSIFGGIISFFGVLVITFYMTVEEDGIKKFLRSVSPVRYQPYIIHKIHQIQKKLGLWLQGQLLLSLIIGVITYIGLLIIGVDYALVLAFVSAVTEFIPYVGPLIGAIPALFLAFTQSPFKAVLVLIVYIVIQQLENQVIVPKVMQRSVGLNPIAVLVVMLIGAQLGGLIGVLLAIPAATIVSVFVQDFIQEKRMRDNRLVEDGGDE